MKRQLCEWQRNDPELGVPQPWFTHAALDEIQTWDLEDQTVLEYGGGFSTLWWGHKCKRVFTIETDLEWISRIRDRLGSGSNVTIFHRAITDLDQYTRLPEGCRANIVVVDAASAGADIVALRHACLERALTLPRPLTIIFDNWQQDSVFVSPLSERMMAPYEGQVYVQPDHMNHKGRPWQTAIWNLP
jgi:hypothetical protein